MTQSPILEKTKELRALMDQSGQAAKLQVVAKVLELTALILGDSVEIPTEVFEALGKDGRKIALSGFCLVMIQTVQEAL